MSRVFLRVPALIGAGILLSASSVSAAVFSELMYRPAENSRVPEYVEIYNERAVTYDLRGCRLTGAIRFLLPDTEESLLEAHGYLVVSRDPAALREGLNALLPDDVVVLEADEAPAGFDPRRHAAGKHYRYTIHNSRVRPVFERNYRWQVKKPLDVAAMNRAAGALIGEHDFSAFRGSKCTAKTTVRTLDGLVWRLEPPALILDAWGRGFLKQMVRNIVGTSVAIGRGRWPAGKMVDILKSRKREEAGRTAPAQGLCLIKVYFDQEEYRRAVGAPDQGD